ncbi:hypothetical protein BS333_02215 [Vibrio azureus]|nr:hypothetical protein BS333_02215 [Vibrio azureus]
MGTYQYKSSQKHKLNLSKIVLNSFFFVFYKLTTLYEASKQSILKANDNKSKLSVIFNKLNKNKHQNTQNQNQT